MDAEEIREQPVEYLLAVTKGADRKDELGEEGHPHDQQYGKDTDEVDKEVPLVDLYSTHTGDLPAIDDQQEHQPASDIEPGSFVEGGTVHLAEFYNKIWNLAEKLADWGKVIYIGIIIAALL